VKRPALAPDYGRGLIVAISLTGFAPYKQRYQQFRVVAHHQARRVFA
jgi:hypothetical protein